MGVLKVMLGSRLSGFHTSSSDYDYYVVSHTHTGSTVQSLDSMGNDITYSSLSLWLKRAREGSHQALDAMFAGDDFVIEDDYSAVRKGWVAGTDTYPSFFSMIKKHVALSAEREDIRVKARRIAYSSVLRLNQLSISGRYDPTATQSEVSTFFDDYAFVDGSRFEERLNKLSVLELPTFASSL